MIRNDFNERFGEAFWDWVVSHSDCVRVIDESTSDETRITLQFRGDGTCPVLIASRNGSTQIHVGQEIRFDEVDGLVSDDGAKLTSLMASQDFILMLDAISAGAVQEEIKYLKGEVVASKGSISMGGKEYKMRTTTLRGLLCRPDKKVSITYLPIKPT